MPRGDSMTATIHQGDCLSIMAGLPADSIDACVTDPPYELGFMGKAWDRAGVAFEHETWAAVLRVLKPGAHLVAFGAPKNYHRLACAIEDAGFEVRDSLMWLFGTGFPKSMDAAKAIDKELGKEGTFGEPKSAAHAGWISRGRMRGDDNEEGWQRPWMDDPEQVDKAARKYLPGSEEAAQWDGWGTALKPAFEPIILARKPPIGTVAANVLAYGTGALNIDGCRVEGTKDTPASPRRAAQNAAYGDLSKDPGTGSGWDANVGRWPANLVHDGSDEVLEGFPESSITGKRSERSRNAEVEGTNWLLNNHQSTEYTDSGSAARFFYCAKATKAERAGSKHPTVKPLALMRWLCRLICPPNGTILDPFAGTGTTGQAAQGEGFSSILIEREAEYVADIQRRLPNVPLIVAL